MEARVVFFDHDDLHNNFQERIFLESAIVAWKTWINGRVYRMDSTSSFIHIIDVTQDKKSFGT